MESIIRKGIAFDREQLRAFDRTIEDKGYKNRSEAIRDLIRDFLIDAQQELPDSRMVATLTFVYNHHDHDVQHSLTHIQHDHTGLIRSSLHIHLDNDNCLEVLILEGKASDIKSLSDSIIASKGVAHGKLVLTASHFQSGAGKKQERPHTH